MMYATAVSVDQLCSHLQEHAKIPMGVIQSSTKQWLAETRHPDSAEKLADWLVDKGIITDIHAAAALSGVEGPIVIGPYEVDEQIATGTAGGLYRAVHRESGKPVSMKIFVSQQRMTKEQAERARREVRLRAQLNHPSVVRSFDFGESNEVKYIVLEDLRGETLGARLARHGSMDYRDACRIAVDIAEGLDALHEQGIVHRDISPDGIWIDEVAGRAKLLEFGAAKASSSDQQGDGQVLTTANTMIGLYDYMSPEQAKDARTVTAVSDLFSLGSTLYHCLAGNPPFHDANPMRILMKVVSESPVPVSTLPHGIPHELDDVLTGLLAKDPADRFQSAKDVVRGLSPFAAQPSDAAAAATDLDPAFSDWLQSLPETPSVGLSPKLARFFALMSERDERRGRARR